MDRHASSRSTTRVRINHETISSMATPREHAHSWVMQKWSLILFASLAPVSSILAQTNATDLSIEREALIAQFVTVNARLAKLLFSDTYAHCWTQPNSDRCRSTEVARYDVGASLLCRMFPLR